jgi:hypothetical protein
MLASETIISDVKDNLAAYLREGDPARGIVGLNGVGDVASNDFDGLRFCLSEGTGTPDDPPLYAKAQVVFQDDDLPGVPCARITLAGGSDDEFDPNGWSLCRWQLRIEVSALSADGALTPGQSARSAEDVLSSWIRRRLRGNKAYGALVERGFERPELRLEGELSRDQWFRNPMIFSFTTDEDT